jgi:hypothetical protein
MTPGQSGTGKRGRPSKSGSRTASKARGRANAAPLDSDQDPFEDSQAPEEIDTRRNEGSTEDVDAEGETESRISEALLTRILHDFFKKESTRITKDANAAVGKYLEIFVGEAIARAAAERDGRFLEVSGPNHPL